MERWFCTTLLVEMARQRNCYLLGHRITAQSQNHFSNGSANAITWALMFKEALEMGRMLPEDREYWIAWSFKDGPAVRAALEALGIH